VVWCGSGPISPPPWAQVGPGEVPPGGCNQAPMPLAWAEPHSDGSIAEPLPIGWRLGMPMENSIIGAHWLKTAPKNGVFYHTFASCQGLGCWHCVFKLIFGEVPTAIRYNLKYVMMEYIAKCHIDGCTKSMPKGSSWCFAGNQLGSQSSPENNLPGRRPYRFYERI